MHVNRVAQYGRRYFHTGPMIAIAAAVLIATGCERKPASQSAAKPAATGPIKVYTTFYPTTYFAERIAGPLATVTDPCPPTADPAFWQPDDEIIGAYQQANLIVLNGASFEKWAARASLPPSRIVETAKPFEREFIIIKNAIHHSHGPSGPHSHEGIDGHTWLDPINAKTQAGEILKALIKLRPQHQAAFEKNFADLTADLDKLDERLKSVSQQIGDRVFFCSHPAYSYIGRRYGWKVVNFTFEPSEIPGEEALAKLREQAEKQHPRIMLWEATPLDKLAAATAAMGLTNVTYTPCETLDAADAKAGVDFLSVMNANVDRLDAALEKVAAQPATEKPNAP